MVMEDLKEEVVSQVTPNIREGKFCLKNQKQFIKTLLFKKIILILIMTQR